MLVPCDEHFVRSTFAQGLVDGVEAADLEPLASAVQRRQLIDTVASPFRSAAPARLEKNSRFDSELVLRCRSAFLTMESPDEVADALLAMDRAGSFEEIFEQMTRSAEHLDIAFAEEVRGQIEAVRMAVDRLPVAREIVWTLKPILARCAYRYGHTIHTGFFGKRKAAKARPPDLSVGEERAFQAELALPIAQLTDRWAAIFLAEAARLLRMSAPVWRIPFGNFTTALQPKWATLGGLTSPSHLVSELPNADALAPKMPRMLEGGAASGIYVRPEDLTTFIGSLRAALPALPNFPAQSAWRVAVLALEAATYAHRKGFGLAEVIELP